MRNDEREEKNSHRSKVEYKSRTISIELFEFEIVVKWILWNFPGKEFTVHNSLPFLHYFSSGNLRLLCKRMDDAFPKGNETCEVEKCARWKGKFSEQDRKNKKKKKRTMLNVVQSDYHIGFYANLNSRPIKFFRIPSGNVRLCSFWFIRFDKRTGLRIS